MKKNLQKKSDRLTRDEKEMLENYWYLPDWQFELLRTHCVLSLERNLWGKVNADKIQVFGLMAKQVNEDGSETRCIGNYFIRHGSKTYQVQKNDTAILIVDALTKQHRIENEVEEQKEAA